MYFLKYLVILTVFYCGFCQEDKDVSRAEESYEEVEENSREAKQLRDPIEHGGWRAVENRNWQNADEWIPKEATFVPESPEKPKRRRIRKRKRRPPPISSSEDSEEYPLRRRRIRPQTLQDVNDSWSEIEQESVRRPYNRRRITPIYSPEIQTKDVIEIKAPSAVLHVVEDENEEPQKPQRVYEKVRDPFTALQEVEAKARLKKKQSPHDQEQNQEQEETTTISSLKALLKQTGALSLSELLQQKNLSLNDLLKGRQQAISILAEKSQVNLENTSENTPKSEAPKAVPKVIENASSTEQMPESMQTENKSENVNKTNESSEELQTPKKQSAPLHKDFERRISTSTRNYEVVTEPTTEHRVFVPSHPKFYTSFNYKPDMSKKVAETILKPTTRASITEKSTHLPPSTTTRRDNLSNKYLDFRSKYVSLRPKLKVLPITSAKLNRLTNKQPATEEPTTTSIPSQAFAIDIKELFGISAIVNKTETKPKEDGPLKMSIDIETFMKKPTTEIVEKSGTDVHQTFKKDLLKDIENSENEVVTNEAEASTIYLEKIKPTSAREEIMEILRDHVSSQNLSRILQLRNMTIEELVAQRERGSSQLHLADIFHNQTREPEPPSEPYVGHIDGVPPFFDRKPKTIPNSAQLKKDSHGSNYFASVIDLRPLELNSADKKTTNSEELTTKLAPAAAAASPRERYTVTSFPTYKIEMEKIIKQNQPPPFQLSVWKSLYPNLYTGNPENTHQDELDALKPTKVDDIFQNEIRRVEDIENAISDAVNDRLNIDVNENNYEGDGYLQLPSGVKSAIIASAAIVGISLLVFLTIFIIFKWSHKQKKRLCYSDSLSCSRIKSPILETRPRRTIRTIMSETLGRKKKYLNVYPQSMSDYMWENDKKPFQ